MDDFEELMAKISASVKSLKDRKHAKPVIDDLLGLQQELDKASDRAFVILWVARLDTQLEEALPVKFANRSPKILKRLYEEEGILQTLSAKIVMGYCLDLYGPKTLHDLDVLRHLRNAFAHQHKPLSFKTKEVVNVCATLQIPAHKGAYHIPPDVLQHARQRGVLTKFAGDSRTRFAVAAHSIALNLVQVYGNPHLDEYKRRKWRTSLLP